MSLKQLIFWITVFAVFAMAARISVDTDTWWHLRAGQWIWENRAIPQSDPFSHTRYGEAWQYPGWLVETPMYLVYGAFGPGALNLWTAAMVTLAFVFIWYALVGGPFLRAFVIVLAATVSGVYWAARPYLVTFLLAGVFLWVLESYRWGRSSSVWKRLWLLPILMILWVNSHGGFVVGFLIWGVYAFNELWGMVWGGTLISNLRDVSQNFKGSLKDPRVVLWMAGALMVLAVCVNPSGTVMLVYPLKTISIGALQDFIQEWQSPDFHQLNVQPFAWMLVLILGAIGASRRRLALTDFLLVGGFAYMALLAARNIALFALATAPVLSRYSTAAFETWRRTLGWRRHPTAILNRKSWLNILLLGLVAIAVMVKVILVLPRAENETVFQDTLPIGAVAYIQTERPPGEMFNSYNWGGYLLWALPDYRVFVDGRTDLYDDEVIGEWIQVVQVEDGWEDILAEYNVNLVLIEADSALDRVLQDDKNWRNAYRDDMAVVYRWVVP